ncbi:hypothetical protein EYC84_000583 [Monilinia fructicola]|uniref:Serine hydrolase domain-containing protein n=1 Tax=Monilinia fructicola TaxID=38448 RepID=A0A5M9JS72_MONFR|nr:hypothetical protein EYC84_000583 [Monilinia fructicola]
MQGIFPVGEYWAFTDPYNPETIIPFLAELEEYIEAEGPFDALFGFSYGAALAGTFLMDQQRKNPMKLSFSFKCAIFICSLAPFKVVGDRVQQMSGHTDGESLSIPTAHIFGSKDDECYEGSLELMKLCNAKVREAFDHGGAHEIPRGGKVTSDMASVITKTIEKALMQH